MDAEDSVFRACKMTSGLIIGHSKISQMYVMSWVGIGTTIGLVMDVPILLRSLADSLAEVNVNHLPLGFHPSLVAALDDGVATECPSRLVHSYVCDWWRHDQEPGPGGILGMDTLDECLDSYRQYIPALVITDSSPAHSQPTNEAGYEADCRSCIDLRALLHDMLDDARGMHGFISGCESSADAAVNANGRKAAGFQRLHELALLKELQGDSRTLSSATASKQKTQCPARPSKQSAVTRQKQSQLVAAQAQVELDRLKALPPTSHKWTWGVDITEEEVLRSNERTKSKGKTHHSGYARSLDDGVYEKEWSSTATLQTAVSPAYSRPPTVTGIDAGLYFADDSSDSEAESDADADGDDEEDEDDAVSGAVPDAVSGAVPDAVFTAVPDAVFAAVPDAVFAAVPDAVFAAVPDAVAHAMAVADESEVAADVNTMLGQPTASDAAMAWQGEEDDTSNGEDQATALQAAMAWQGIDSSSSSSHNTGSPTGSDAAAMYLADSASSSPPPNRVSTAFPTASDAADVFLASSETDSDNSSAESNPTPSLITLPIYTHVDFSYVDDTWLTGSEMMDTTDNE